MTAMGNEIPVQLAQFFRAILLGATLALLYDLVRALSSLGGKFLEIVLDTSVSLVAALSVFLFVMAEEGELRLFILLGAGGGAVLFFSVLSGVLRPIWAFWVDVFLFPFHLGGVCLKKLYISFKKVFSFCRRWFTIMVAPKLSSCRKEREHGP